MLEIRGLAHSTQVPTWKDIKSTAPFVLATASILGAFAFFGQRPKDATYIMHLNELPAAANQSQLVKDFCVSAQEGLIIAVPYKGRDYQMRCPTQSSSTPAPKGL